MLLIAEKVKGFADLYRAFFEPGGCVHELSKEKCYQEFQARPLASSGFWKIN
jgi:hypothetical protein